MSAIKPYTESARKWLTVSRQYKAVNLNFSDIARPINGQLLHRIDGIKKQGEIKNRYLRKRYGKSKQMRWIGETPLVPLAYVQFKIPMRKSRKINPYTPEGKAEIHDNLRIDVNSMLWLMRHPIPTESVRYNDNRVSLYAGQDGKCAITGKKLDVQTCICYRKTNNCKKGNDSYQNLLLLSLQGLAIVSQSYYQSEQTACYRRTAATGGKVANLANVKE